MQPSDFTQTKYGKLVKDPHGYWAYVPFPLPPEIDITLDLVSKLSKADRAISELAGIARTLPNPHLLIGPFVRREAVLSSRIEGTQASLSDLFFFEAAYSKEKEVPDVREVSNYVTALEYGLDRLEDLPVSLRLLKEIHARLMEGVRGTNQTPGEFRRSQNWIGPAGCTLMDATFVPPPVDEMHKALDAFEKYIHTASDLPPLIRLPLIHYQFEAIHPFLDGNGRIGRLLITLLLCADNLLPQPLLYLSAFFERYRNEYYQRLIEVTLYGKWKEWILYFLSGITSQAHDAIRRSDRLLGLWQKYRTRLQEARASALLLQLVDELFSYPAITNAVAARKLSVTPRSAQLNIDKLRNADILQEATGRQRNRIYIAPEIISIIEQPEA
jgi:Fic family protein